MPTNAPRRDYPRGNCRSGRRTVSLGPFPLALLDTERALGSATAWIGSSALVVGASMIPVFASMGRVRERIFTEKRAELERVEAAIRGDAGALRETRIADRAGVSLADLIAYRGLIQSASEWPLDLSSLARVALYLLIPAGSWVAGALVERLVGLALD